MNKFENFTEDEIPYEILSAFGITQEMMDDLPSTVKNQLLSGRATPVIPIVTTNFDGDMVQSYAKMSLIRKGNGNVDVMFMPMWDSNDLSEFEEDVINSILSHHVATADVTGKGRCYIQFDDTINQAIFVPVGVINKNISCLANSYGWHELDDMAVQEGEIVTVNVQDELYSVGIDLNEGTGIRIVHGNEQEWTEEVKARNLPEYNFGIYGCWIADDNNRMKYVAEEDYDDGIRAEQKRIAGQNAAAAHMQQMHY